MMILLAMTAWAQQTRLFAGDDEAREWIKQTRSITRQRLPILGPVEAKRLLPWGSDLDVRFVPVPKGGDLDAAALRVRLEDGSACALVFTPAEAGWVGWVSGSCGQLALGAWQLDGDRVLDFRGHPLTVAQFAAATGDRDMLKRYRRLDRRRGRAITFTLLGTGALWFTMMQSLDHQSALPAPVLYGITGIGGALTTLGVVEFVAVGVNPRARPRNIGSHLSHEAIRERVIDHNRRLSFFIGPGSAHGTF